MSEKLWSLTVVWPTWIEKNRPMLIVEDPIIPDGWKIEPAPMYDVRLATKRLFNLEPTAPREGG